MSVMFDATTAGLRLDAESFITLAEYATDPAGACDRTLRDLADVGAVVDGAPHPALRGALAAVTNSLASLQVLVTEPEGVALHQGWLARVSAMLTDLGDGTYDFESVGTEFVPTTIARLAGLGPRPRLAAGSVSVDEEVLDGLVSNFVTRRAATGEALADLLTPWPAVSAAARMGGWRTACVDIAFPVRDRTVARRLAWVDTDAGMLRVEADDHGPVLVPTTPTELWRALVSILPADLDTDSMACPL
jgi:hypothetical protein